MRDELAQRLLVTVLDWDAIRSGRELPRLQDMAHYKYDEYQQFGPGMRFIESLAQWLDRLEPEDRETAYEFVRDRLVFCSSAELEHLVGMAWPDRIRPRLVRSTADELQCDPRHVRRIVASRAFQVRKRQCLFLGLSDGARIDMFRRANNFDLSHEQISQSHELADDRIRKLLRKLAEDLTEISGGDAPNEPVFRTIVLLDDFSASGRSYYMPESEEIITGKLARFHKEICNPESGLSQLVQLDQTDVHIVFYVATENARSHLIEFSEKVWLDSVASITVDVVQLLPISFSLSRDRLHRENAGPLAGLIDKYYDDSLHDEHLQKGDTEDARYGFAAGGLPFVMSHNTPNNSIALLWSYHDTKYRGLFPRVRRHKATGT